MENNTMKPLDLNGDFESLVDNNYRKANKKAEIRRRKFAFLLMVDLVLAACIIILFMLSVWFNMDKMILLVVSDVLAIPGVWIAGRLWELAKHL